MILTVDGDCRDLASVEHLVHQLDEVLGGLLDEEAGYVASTHVVRTPPARFVVALSWPDDGSTDDAVAEVVRTALPGVEVGSLAEVVAEASSRAAGRLARYPGRRLVERRTTAGAVVDASCVDAVEGLAGVTVTPETELDLTGFARPTWREGRCTLLVQPARGVLVPFEVRHQVSCCADH